MPALSSGGENDAFEQLFVMYGHGNSDKNTNTCEYMMLSAEEYVHTLELQYSTQHGLDRIFIKSSKAQELAAGTVEKSDKTKVIQFNESYQLIGLKGLGSELSLDSIGMIVFDTTCDVTDPSKTLGEASTEITEVVAPLEPEPEVKEEEKKQDVTKEQDNNDDGSVDGAVIFAICAFIALIIVLGVGIHCYCKHVVKWKN